MSQLQCELCLKPHEFCTCVGAEKKHPKELPPKVSVVREVPEDVITEPSRERSLDVSGDQTENPEPVEVNEEAPVVEPPRKGKKSKR